MLPEGGGDDGAALEAGLDPAPGGEVDVLHLLLVELLTHIVQQPVLVIHEDGEVGEAWLRYHVLDGQLRLNAERVAALEQAGDTDQPHATLQPPVARARL